VTGRIRHAIARSGRFADAHPALVRYGAATVVYALALVVPFHAVIAHPGSRLVGLGDGTGTLRNYWAASLQHRSPFDLHHDTTLGAPEGTAMVPADVLSNGGLETAFVWEAKGALGLVGAYNAFLLLGFFATGIAMFAFLSRLGCTFGASLLGGYVFGFCPYALEHVYAGQLGFAHNWVLVLIAALMLRLRRTQAWHDAVAAGAAVAVAFYLSAYEGLVASILVFAFALVDAVRAPDRRLRMRRSGRSAGVYVVAILALTPILALYAQERSAVNESLVRNVDATSKFGAAFGAYFLPSPRNPLDPSWLARLHSVNLIEETLFFGYAAWALALVAAVLVARSETGFLTSEGRRHAALCLLALVPVAFLMSLPPHETLAGLSIPTPPRLIQYFTTYWRAYARVGVDVGFAVAALAALALTVLSRQRGRRWRLFTPVAALVIFLELFPGNVDAFDADALPGWVTWLRSHPGGIVATYPWVSFGEEFNKDMWYQVYDGHPRFVSEDPTGPDGAIRLLARDFWRPITARVLAAEGVRYVVVHEDAGGPARTESGQYALVEQSGGVRIYRVDAKPIDLTRALRANAVELASLQGLQSVFSYVSGFNTAEQFNGQTSRWMIQDGELEVNSNQPAQITLRGSAFSNSRPRLLMLEAPSGQVLARQTIPASAVEIRFGPFLVPSGTTRLRLVAQPGPAQLGAGDPRQASVFIEPLAMTALPGYTAPPGTPSA
jgi:hypothetical protein